MKQEAINYIESLKEDILNISKYIYDNPEESYKENKSYKFLVNFLRLHKFSIKEHFLDIDTSFYASIGTGYPKICFLCQYDAVPKEGHITGHNTISAMSIGAALGLSKILSSMNCTIILLGCPGEYVGNAIVTMAKQGVFDDIDAVLMAHPHVTTSESGTSNAIIPLSIRYSYHSDALSFMNKSNYTALDAMMVTFNIINSIDKTFHEDASINWILSEGGTSPFLVPKDCEAKFYIRAKNTELATLIEKKFKIITSCICELTNMNCKTSIYGLPYKEFITNPTLSRLFSHNLKEQGIIDVNTCLNVSAGISLGDVSHICPTIHPYVKITDNDEVQYGTKAFGESTTSQYCEDTIIKTSKALACTAIDLIENKHLLSQIKAEFQDKKITRH